MTTFHAVVRIDHQTAQIFQFDAQHVQSDIIKAHQHYTAQHGSSVRTEHEFFGEVADGLAGIKEVLVAGSGSAPAAFRAYCEKHRPQVAPHIVGVEIINQPTEPQLLALARKYFLAHDRMAGIPTPT